MVKRKHPTRKRPPMRTLEERNKFFEEQARARQEEQVKAKSQKEQEKVVTEHLKPIVDPGNQTTR